MKRCVFLDRDGVINEKAADGEYILRWQDFRLIPATIDWIKLFNALGFLVIVVTNQRVVAKGLITGAGLDSIHAEMTAVLLRHGARLDDVFCCPHEQFACECRKPKPGLVLEAQRKWDIDLEHSLMIGDSKSDFDLARTCGMGFIRTAHGRIVDSTEWQPGKA
jgi:D-glycero-D-manno-heptose 1,7-bisphosphate phosphatase